MKKPSRIAIVSSSLDFPEHALEAISSNHQWTGYPSNSETGNFIGESTGHDTLLFSSASTVLTGRVEIISLNENDKTRWIQTRVNASFLFTIEKDVEGHAAIMSSCSLS